MRSFYLLLSFSNVFAILFFVNTVLYYTFVFLPFSKRAVWYLQLAFEITTILEVRYVVQFPEMGPYFIALYGNGGGVLFERNRFALSLPPSLSLTLSLLSISLSVRVHIAALRFFGRLV